MAYFRTLHSSFLLQNMSALKHITLVFTVMGLFHLKYFPKTQKFKTSKFLRNYSIILAIAIYVYCLFYYYKKFGISWINFETMQLREVIVCIDYSLEFGMAILTYILILMKRNQICFLLNNIMEFTKYFNHKKNVNFFKYKVLYGTLMTVIIGGLICNGNVNGYFNAGLIVGILLPMHYFFGHIYEMILLETLLINFKFLVFDLYTIPENLHQNLTLYFKICKICKMSSRIFNCNKIFTLLCFSILFSIYWFYNFDNIVSVFNGVLWQLNFMPVILVCNSWNRINGQVS